MAVAVEMGGSTGVTSQRRLFWRLSSFCTVALFTLCLQLRPGTTNLSPASQPQTLPAVQTQLFRGGGTVYGAGNCTADEAGIGSELEVEIFVFAWRRLASLQRLVKSLQAALYCGHTVALTFLFDAGASPAVVAYARAVVWQHGRVRCVVEDTSHGVRGMWIDVLSRELELHSSSSTHFLPLEDDVEVSPLYYYWLRRAAQAYHGPTRSGKGAPASPRLLGISLYSPRLDEVHAIPLRAPPPAHRRGTQ